MYPFIKIDCESCNNSTACSCKNSCGDPMLSTNLIAYQGPDLLCTDIKNCESLTSVIQKLEVLFCNGFALPTKTSDLINDGSDGTSVFIEADELSIVAISGSYNDLVDTPAIPELQNLQSVLDAGSSAQGSMRIAQGTEATAFYGHSIVVGDGEEVRTRINKGSIEFIKEFVFPLIGTVSLVSNIQREGDIYFQLPDKPEGVYTLATIEDIPTVETPSLQEVIDVNKVADRVIFLKNIINGGKVYGDFVYLTSTAMDTIDTSKSYMYGSFFSVDGIQAINIARLNSDFSLDESFITGNGFNLPPVSGSTVLVDNFGKLYISGNFTDYNGTLANRIISLNNDGSVNTTFNYGTGFNGYTGKVAFNSNKSAIYVSGIYNDYNGTAANRIIKLNLDGSVDASFNYGVGFDNTTVDILVNPDDSLIVTGFFSNYKGVSVPKIVRIFPNGDIDSLFDVGTGYNSVGQSPNFIFRNSLGVLISYGYFTYFNGEQSGRIVALNDDGSINSDYDFYYGFNDDVYNIKELPNGKYLAEGSFTQYNNVESNGLIMLNSDFTVYKTFTESYYNIIVTPTTAFAMTFVDNHDQIFNLDDGEPITEKVLSFSEVTGKAEYLIGGLNSTSKDELLPKRLIEQMIKDSENRILATEPEFKSYKAILYYTGGEFGYFEVVQLKNDLGEEVVWSRDSTGIFKGILINAFPRISTLFVGTGKADLPNGLKFDTFVTEPGRNERRDEVSIFSYSVSSGLASDDPFTFHVLIEVYPEQF